MKKLPPVGRQTRSRLPRAAPMPGDILTSKPVRALFINCTVVQHGLSIVGCAVCAGAMRKRGTTEVAPNKHRCCVGGTLAVAPDGRAFSERSNPFRLADASD